MASMTTHKDIKIQFFFGFLYNFGTSGISKRWLTTLRFVFIFWFLFWLNRIYYSVFLLWIYSGKEINRIGFSSSGFFLQKKEMQAFYSQCKTTFIQMMIRITIYIYFIFFLLFYWKSGQKINGIVFIFWFLWMVIRMYSVFYYDSALLKIWWINKWNWFSSAGFFVIYSRWFRKCSPDVWNYEINFTFRSVWPNRTSNFQWPLNLKEKIYLYNTNAMVHEI